MRSPLYPPVTYVEEHHYYPPVMPPEPLVPVETTIVRGQPVGSPLDPSGCLEETLVVEDELSFATEPCDDTSPFVDTFALENSFNVRFEIDYAADEDDVSRLGFGLLANATGGIGVDTGVRLFRERAGDVRDHMWVGDFNMVYELFPSQHVRTRAGIGVNFLADHYGGEAGLNLTAGTDIFADAFTLSGEFDLGTVGDADLFHGRASIALRHSSHVESFVGYDYLDIGGVKIHGLLAGVRFRF